jgi:2-iminobutanoate/2-iminopropanoate deaminase
MRQVVSADTSNPAVRFSPAIQWGDLLFVSGQVPIDLTTMAVIGDDIDTQARLALDRLIVVLRAAGTEPENILRLECFLSDATDFNSWNTVFAEYFPSSPPARTTLIAGFVLPEVLIEVQAIAGIPASGEEESS